MVDISMERVSPSDLKPHPKNSRKHSPEQIQEIAASIRQFGFMRPIIVNGEQVILAGHGARLGAIEVGLKEVPIVVATGLTDEQERAYVIADNRLAEKGKWDWALLAGELQVLQDLIPLTDFGFAEWAAPKDNDGTGSTEIDPKTLDGEHRCPRCGFEWT